MKVTSLDAYFAELKKEQPLVAILGKEAADREAALRAVRHSDAVLFDAESATLDKVLAELESYSMFGETTQVIIHHLDKAKKALLDYLATYATKVATPLVVVGEKLNGSTKIYKNIVSHGLLLDIPQLKAWELEKQLPGWVMGEAKKLGKQIGPPAAHALVQQAGSDKTLLQRELEKLACYVGERPELTTQDIAAVCTVTSSANGWDLPKALFQGRTGDALRLGQELLRNGLVLPQILRQLRNQMAADLQVWSIMSSGGTPQEVTAEFPYMRNRILNEHIDNARRFGGDRLKRALVLIDQTDLKSKNSQVDHALLLDQLLARI